LIPVRSESPIILILGIGNSSNTFEINAGDETYTTEEDEEEDE